MGGGKGGGRKGGGKEGREERGEREGLRKKGRKEGRKGKREREREGRKEGKKGGRGHASSSFHQSLKNLPPSRTREAAGGCAVSNENQPSSTPSDNNRTLCPVQAVSLSTIHHLNW